MGNTVIQPGERMTIGLPTPELYSYASLHIPIHIIHGKKTGPTLLICSAIHGDEMNGIAIIHRLLNLNLLKSIYGTLIAVPVINVYGLITLNRNLPDKRDLDGSFPGSESGSFASRLAHYFEQQILNNITHCIDIHAGGPHQNFLPQIHANLHVPEIAEFAKSFRAPVMLHSESNRGLLWQNMRKEQRVPTLIYEAGAPLKLDELSIRTGLRGILRVMRHLNMLGLKSKHSNALPSALVNSSTWLRSPGSGLCQLYKKLGSYINKGEKLAEIYDPFGTSQKFQIIAPINGMILAHNTLPLVNEGDPILQIAQTGEVVSPEKWEEQINPTIEPL